ncbi:MAG TPA: FAD-binding oxidoreductase [Myxococcaceae bacterium]|nr:FAD-binding oxidoreductase [Myxococcaceae bacterium]
MRRGGPWVSAAGAGVLVAGGAAAYGLSASRGRSRRRSVPEDAAGRATREARHRDKVDRVAAQLRAHRGPGPLSFKKRAVSHEVPKSGDLRHRDRKIDLSDLDEILHVDPVRRTCVAEPGVAFVDLVEATLRHGLVPVVVPELKTITVGGAVAGCSLESTSFYSGGFHDSCLEYEVITARGEVLTCTRENEHRLLFEMMHGAFGTLGVLSRLTFKLMPARPFVRVQYEKHATLDSYLASIRRHAELRDADFMDGIIHSPAELVLSMGHFTDEAPYAHRYDWMRIYPDSTRTRTEDYLRTADYFYRYDRGVTNVHPRSFPGRLLFGKLLSSSRVLWLADRFHWLLGRFPPPVTVDVFVPYSRAAEFLGWYREAVGHFPLWCVPYRIDRPYAWLSDRFVAGMRDDLFLDLAIYGFHPAPGANPYRLLEEKLMEIGGVKTLISTNLYSEEEFWRTWNRPNYEAVKGRVDPDNRLRGLYEKMCRAAQGVG